MLFRSGKLIYKGKQYQFCVRKLYLEQDVAVITVVDKTFPSCSDITKHLNRAKAFPDLNHMDAWHVMNDEARSYVNLVHMQQRTSYSVRGTTMKYDGMKYTAATIITSYPAMFTQKGDCGTFFVVNNTAIQRKLIGFHCAATTQCGYIALLSAEMFEDMAERESGKVPVKILPHQSVVLLDEPKVAEFSEYMTEIGFVTNPNTPESLASLKLKPPITTGLTDSPLFYDIDEQEYDIAPLYAEDPRIISGDFNENVYHKWKQPPFDPDESILTWATNSLIDEAHKALASEGIKLKRLTTPETINRCTLYACSNSMTIQTSAGFPYNKYKGATGKHQIFEQDENTLLYRFRDNTISRRVQAEMNQIETLAYQGIRTASVFTVAAKDEIRKKEKVEVGGTRAFAMCPVSLVLAHRKNFHAASAALAGVRGNLSMKVGFNPFSREGDELYKYMAEVGTHGWDLDFKAFDSTTPKKLFEQVPIFFDGLYEALDPHYKPEDHVMRTTLYKHIIEPFYAIGSRVYKASTGQPSGEPGTAIDNSIMNKIINLYCYYKLAMEHAPQEAHFDAYQNNVRFACYGDDCMLVVAPQCLKWFNYENISALIRKDFGMTVTPGDKGSDTKCKKIEEMVFLQRFFRYDDDLRMFVMPLLKTSIKKMSSYTKSSRRYVRVGSEGAPPPDPLSLAATAEAMMQEAAYHGSSFFAKTKKHIRECLRADLWPNNGDRGAILRAQLSSIPPILD